MQVQFNAVYERAKATTKRVVFVIEEAYYLLNDATSSGVLETAIRHSRYYDLSLQFITQTGGEFPLMSEARTIADLCSIALIHRVNEHAEKLAEWFGLSDREVNWIRTPKAGNDEDGYSELLLGIDEEGWLPIRVRASPHESRITDAPIRSEAPMSDTDARTGRYPPRPSPGLWCLAGSSRIEPPTSCIGPD